LKTSFWAGLHRFDRDCATVICSL